MLFVENESGSFAVVEDRSEAFQLQQEDVERGEKRAKIRRHERELEEAEEELEPYCGCMGPERRGFSEVAMDILGTVLRGKKK